jgi:carboxypeptidase Taq
MRSALELWKDADAIGAAISLMNWDQQVMMAPGGAAARAEQVTHLAKQRHALMTSDEMDTAVETLRTNQDPKFQAIVRVLDRDLFEQRRMPSSLVERKARASAAAYEAWKRAKPANDYAAVRPHYEELFAIARETSALLGKGDHPYDALIDKYEEGATFASARNLFDQIAPVTINLLAQVKDLKLEDSLISKAFDQDKLLSFMRNTVSEVGFAMSNGRLDICRNAFCTNLGRSDVRMTTRPSNHLKGIVSSSLHEMGHGLYEQGIGQDLDGTPLAGGISLGVHESQSRLWENIVGRSLGFWKFFLPKLQQVFPELAPVGPEDFYRMMNKVQPSFVRVGADELSYNLHILVRFELEVELLTEKTSFADLPEAWNDKYKRYLGIEPTTDTDGCLQDVHWSRGSVGYFPTYTLGNLMSYQIWDCLTTDIPNWDTQFEQGDFSQVHDWLRSAIYCRGRLHRPSDLMKLVTGKEMEAAGWLAHVPAKVRRIYELA